MYGGSTAGTGPSAASGLDYLVMRNIAVTMPRVLGSPTRASLALQLVDGLFKFIECIPKYCDIQDINVNLDKVWIYPSGNQVLALKLASTITYTTGATRRIKNVNIQFGEDPLVAYGTFAYAGNDVDDYNYFPLYINANNYDNGVMGSITTSGGDPFIVDSITVNNERGKAASFFGVQVSNSTFKGAVNFGAQTKADISSVTSWFPGAFIKMGVASTVHIGTVTAKTDNASYPYTNQIVTYSVAGVGISLVVDNCSTVLASDTKTTAETYLNYDYSLICKSAWKYLGNTNYFTADSFNHYARSVNMPRTGGATASIAFNSLKLDNITPLIIGRAPMLGAQVTVGSIGRYRLSYYVATQTGAFTDLTMIPRRFRIKVRVPQNAGGDAYADYYSDICGVYKTDATSVWNNVSVGGMWRIDTYINCPTTNPVSVEFEFNWFGTGVFLLDPQYELVSAT
jgi:hypothetical protein